MRGKKREGSDVAISLCTTTDLGIIVNTVVDEGAVGMFP